MKEKTIKILKTLGIAGIIFLSIFVVTTQIQLFELKSTNGEMKELPLLAKIFVDEKSGTVPFDVNFTAFISNAKGHVDYQWDFGDGITSTELKTSHIYEVNGSFLCTLKVTDSSGKDATDTIKIVTKDNEAPMATIKINDANVIRNYIPILPKLADPFGGRKLYRLMSIGLLPASLFELGGQVHCDAQVSDPEGDEIVSYKWVLTTPTITTFTGTIQPKYEFEGESVTLPLLYTYGNGQYDIQLTVVDSAGNNATVNIPFKIDKSSFEVTTSYLIKTIIIQQFLNTIYAQYLTPEQQHLISDPLWNYLFGPIEKFTFEILNKTILPIMPEKLSNLVLKLYYSLWGMVEQKFPRPIETADLTFSEIGEFNLSTFVESNGSVPVEADISRTFTITNSDSSISAKNLYIMLKKPGTDEKGLPEELETSEFEVSVSIGGLSKKLFIDGTYKNCFLAEKLDPSDEYTVDLIVTLNEAEEGTFEKGVYECSLFIYQEDAKHIDEVSFIITV